MSPASLSRSSVRSRRKGRARRRGTIIVLSAIMMIVMIAMLALALDVGQIQLARSELARSVDAAALAGAGALVDGEDAARDATVEYLVRNPMGRFQLVANNDELAGAERGVSHEIRGATPAEHGALGSRDARLPSQRRQSLRCPGCHAVSRSSPLLRQSAGLRVVRGRSPSHRRLPASRHHARAGLFRFDERRQRAECHRPTGPGPRGGQHRTDVDRPRLADLRPNGLRTGLGDGSRCDAASRRTMARNGGGRDLADQPAATEAVSFRRLVHDDQYNGQIGLVFLFGKPDLQMQRQDGRAVGDDRFLQQQPHPEGTGVRRSTLSVVGQLE